MKKKLVVATVATVIAAIFLTGCTKGRPKVPSVLSRKVINYESTNFNFDKDVTDYKRADDNRKKRIRNDIVFRLKRIVDSYYSEFEIDLANGRARGNILADFIEIGAGVATGITNGERVKNILAIALTGFKGARKSVDQNFFRERTTEILSTKMRASRARVEADITGNLDLDVTAYPLDKALGDIVRYFYAGTLQNAFQELSAQTAQDAQEAQRTARGADEVRASIQAEYDDSLKFRLTLKQLNADISSNDEIKRDAAKERILKALNKVKDRINVAFSKNDSARDLLRALIAAFREADNKKDNTLINDMLKEMR